MSPVIVFLSLATDIIAISLGFPSLVTFDSEREENYAKFVQDISVCDIEVIFKVV